MIAWSEQIAVARPSDWNSASALASGDGPLGAGGGGASSCRVGCPSGGGERAQWGGEG